MYCHSGDFIRFYMWSDCCGCCQNKQDGGRQISSQRRETGWVFANRFTNPRRDKSVYWLWGSYLLCITVTYDWKHTKRVSKYSYTKYWTRKLFLHCHPWWQGLQCLVHKRNMNLLWSKSAKASPTRDRKTSCNIVTPTSCRKPIH